MVRCVPIFDLQEGIQNTKAQCLTSYFQDPGKFSMISSIVFQASTGKKLRGKNHRQNHGTRKDDKHSAKMVNNFGTNKDILMKFSFVDPHDIVIN